MSGKKYLEWTAKIPVAKKGEKINKTAALQRQLLKDQAENKNRAVIEIINKLMIENSYQNTLIYCPKGINDTLPIEDTYINQLKLLIRANFPILNITEFVSDTSDRKSLLKDFEDEMIHMLLAIKCLDEGVNIPKTINAIFVASGQNYREFIQRRGRVLRKYEKDGFKKEYANIFDVIILPTYAQFQKNKKTATNLIISEFKRLYEFNRLAIPSFTITNKISNCLSVFGFTESYIISQISESK